MDVSPSENDNQVREILFAWEKRRLLYNAIHFVNGLFLLVLSYAELRKEIHPLEMFAGVAAIAVGANICYFLAPMSEVYSLIFLRLAWHGWMRNLIFWTGTIFSTLLMQATVAASLLSIWFSEF